MTVANHIWSLASHWAFPVCLGVLIALRVVLSRRGRRSIAFFESVLGGACLLIILVLCRLLTVRVRSEGLAMILAGALMLSLVASTSCFLLPRVKRLSQSVDWRLLNVVACVLLGLLYTTGIWPVRASDGPWRETIPFLASVAALVSFLTMVFRFAEKCHVAARMTLVEDSVRLMMGEVAIHRAAIDAARRQRHDQRHHRIALAEFLLRGQVDKALRYLEQLDSEAGETPTDKLIWCENDTINAILSGSARKAAAKGVDFEVTANVDRTVDLPDIDIVVVVANLVENAINAAGSESACRAGAGERKVTIALRQRERTVGMTVTNPVPDGFALSEIGLPCDKPGVGLESVSRVIRRHRGELMYTVRDGILECQAMMRVEGEGMR